MKPNELPPPAQLMKFIVEKWISKPIYVAAELGRADMLTEGPKSIEELAQASQSHAASLYRVMRALASVDIFFETEAKRFELTPMANKHTESSLVNGLFKIYFFFHNQSPSFSSYF